MQTLDALTYETTARLPAQGSYSTARAGLPDENTPPIGGRVTVEHGNALVVFEGAARIAWHRRTSSDWIPVGLWPRPDEAVLLEGRLERGDPVLVILSEPVATVPLLVEELAASGELFAPYADPAEGHLVELRLPALDWLPDDVRARGLEFLARTDKVIATTPHALCPPFLLDDPGPEGSNVRFVRPRRGERATDADCRALVEHVFATTLVPAAS